MPTLLLIIDETAFLANHHNIMDTTINGNENNEQVHPAPLTHTQTNQQ